MTFTAPRARAAALLIATAALAAAGTATAHADDSPGGWTPTGSSRVNSLTGGEGIATAADGSLLTRGLGSIPLGLRAAGWNHVGDPDISGGYIFDAYQGGDDATSKMFASPRPSGSTYQYTHPLDSGEMLNNSFATVSPDSQWLVAGEWGTINRLQVFPAPLTNPSTPATGGTLAQAGQITLDQSVDDIQGCDFVSATRLVCSSDDAEPRTSSRSTCRTRWTARRSPATSARSSRCRSTSICSGTFEAEGIDYDPSAKVLRVEIVSPSVCEVATTVYSYAPTTG